MAADIRIRRYSSTIYFGKADVSIASRLRLHYNGRGSTIAELLADGHSLLARWWRTFKEPRAVE